MSEFVFSFLEEEFRDIYLDCARMDKNLIEGDGLESILIAGRIAEKITKSIFAFEAIKEVDESQYKRIEKLSQANIIPNNIKRDLSEIRRLRNNVYHNSESLISINSHRNQSRPYLQSGGLRDYKTGFKDIKSSSSSNNSNFNSNSKYGSDFSNSKGKNYDVSGELEAAQEAHRLVFNICVWFYANYSGDKEFIRPKYKLSRRTQDADFIIRLKSAVNHGDDFLKLKKGNPDNDIIRILDEIHIKKPAEEAEEERVYGINNKKVKIREPDKPYSQCMGISYDDNLFMWKARHGTKDLGLYASSKEAYEAREIYIHSIPMPKKVNGAYSSANGISFSRIQKLWSASVKGRIISYHSSEEKAIRARKKYLKEKGLVDVEVDGGFRTLTLEEKKKLDEKAKAKKSEIKTVSSSSSMKKELQKDYLSLKEEISKSSSDASKYDSDLNNNSSILSKQIDKGASSLSDRISRDISDLKFDLDNVGSDNKKDSSNKSLKSDDSKNKSSKSDSSKIKPLKTGNSPKQNKLAYAKEFKKENPDLNSSKDKNVKVRNGSKISDKSNRKVKVNSGKRVSKSRPKAKKSVQINKKKSSRYEGVYYEEGLFMWSAEVDGKHLGLFSSEKEAYEKREEYIQNKSK